MTEIALLFVEVTTADGPRGVGFSYSKRAGGPGQFAHAKEIAQVADRRRPQRHRQALDKLCWAGASVGRSGLATQAIGAFDVALWDLKAQARRAAAGQAARRPPRLGARYNTSGGFLHTPLEQLLVNAAALARARHRRHQAQGRPARLARPTSSASRRCASTSATTCRSWSTPTSSGTGRPRSACAAIFEQFDLVWIEEPLDAYDHEGHAALAARFDTPIATGEMLTSVAEHVRADRRRRRRHPDARRAPGRRHHAVPEGSPRWPSPRRADARAALRDGDPLHLAAAYPTEPWVEHFDWLDPLFNERLEIHDGRMWVPTGPASASP